MRFEANVRIQAPVAQVWACLLDLSLVGSCVGDGIEISGETAVGETISAMMGVGFSGQRVSAKAELTWLEIEPQHKMVMPAKVWVTDNTPVTVDNEVVLVEEGDETLLQWQAKVTLAGKLRGVPPTLVRTFVAQQSRAFFVCFKGKVEGLSHASFNVS